VSTGFPGSDAQSDFSRARRARLLSDIGRRLRREPDDVALMLPFEEVVEALGRTGQTDHGLQIVPLDAIVGSVDRTVDFDRGLRPTSARLRSRWERIAAAQRRGEALPPVSLYKIGDLYFVRDGHHRVSVAKSLGRADIDAYVTEVNTRVKLSEDTRVSDLPLKDHERLFRERVPLPAEMRRRISLSDPWDFGMLSEAVEAWGFRAMQSRGTYMDRAEVARLWFSEEYEPVVELLQTGDLIHRDETETDAYLRVAGDRYRALRTHEWSDEVLEQLRREERVRRRRRRTPPRPLRRKPLWCRLLPRPGGWSGGNASQGGRTHDEPPLDPAVRRRRRRRRSALPGPRQRRPAPQPAARQGDLQGPAGRRAGRRHRHDGR
jgi:hypothetical protein